MGNADTPAMYSYVYFQTVTSKYTARFSLHFTTPTKFISAYKVRMSFYFAEFQLTRVANRPEFYGIVPNSAAVSRVPNGSIQDRLMFRIFTVLKVMLTRILISGF